MKDPPAEPLNIASGEAVRSTSCGTSSSSAAARSASPSTRPTCRRRPGIPSTRARRSRAPARSSAGRPPCGCAKASPAPSSMAQSQRNADPNAWFAPKDEPAPRKRLSLPNIPVPTRRFGSVVTPAFGVPVHTTSSRASPLPTPRRPRRCRAATTRSSRRRRSRRGRRRAARPPPAPASSRRRAGAKKKEEVLEVSDADLVEEEENETKMDDGLEFEWAPVPSVPGMGR